MFSLIITPYIICVGLSFIYTHLCLPLHHNLSVPDCRLKEWNRKCNKMSYNSYNSSGSAARRPSRTTRSPFTTSQSSRDIYSPSSFSTTFRNSGVGYPVTTSPSFQSTYSSPSYSVSSGPGVTIPIQSVTTNGHSNGYHSHLSPNTNNNVDNQRWGKIYTHLHHSSHFFKIEREFFPFLNFSSNCSLSTGAILYDKQSCVDQLRNNLTTF